MHEQTGTATAEIVERIVDLYRRHATLYQKDEIRRRGYFGKHPTFFCCLKCMDGRVEFPTMTNTARGIVKPYRAAGGKFELWWPAFQRSFSLWIKRSIVKSAHSCVFVSSHYCSAYHDLGCKGWDNDLDAARANAERLSRQMLEDFDGHVVAIPTSVDTALDNLILHGPCGDIEGGMLAGVSQEDIRAEVRQKFPDMPEKVIDDLLPFITGNAERVADIRRHPRTRSELEHDERVIAIGEGFDGLATHNFAFMNSDINPNVGDDVVLGAKMIASKAAGGSRGQQVAIFTNIYYGAPKGILSSLPALDKRCATRRSRGLQEFAQAKIRERCPELWHSGNLHFLTAITREVSRELVVVEQGPVLR